MNVKINSYTYVHRKIDRNQWVSYPKFQQDLNIALESEILGELIFLNAAQHSCCIEQQQKWKTLAHEHALAEFASQELKGNSTSSLVAVEKLLKS
jgi:hypothetical protein